MVCLSSSASVGFQLRLRVPVVFPGSQSLCSWAYLWDNDSSDNGWIVFRLWSELCVDLFALIRFSIRFRTPFDSFRPFSRSHLGSSNLCFKSWLLLIATRGWSGVRRLSTFAPSILYLASLCGHVCTLLRQCVMEL